MTDIPRRAVGRTARLAALPLGFAGRAALGFGKRVTGMASEVISAEVQLRTAEHLFKVLGQLKGGAMKMGQALSVFEAALPEEIAGPYRAALTRLQEAAPPLPAASVHKVIHDEFGPRWRQRFRELDDTPAAAASIGQVHRAVWRDGREVAVKVQYPGAGEALVADLNQLGRLATLFRVIQPGLDVKPLVTELRARITEELDYELEAASQRAFARAYADDEEIHVPQVIAASPRLLVTEWIDGTPMSRIIASGTAGAARPVPACAWRRCTSPRRAGPACCTPTRTRATSGCSTTAGSACSTSAPSPGCPDGHPEPVGRLTRLAIQGRADEVLAGLRAEGFVRADVEVDAEAVLEFIRPMLEPIVAEEFQFTRAWLRGEAARVAHPRSEAYQLSRNLNLPPAYLLIHRVTLGSIGVLCQLEARAPYRGVVERWLPGFAEPVPA